MRWEPIHHASRTIWSSTPGRLFQVGVLRAVRARRNCGLSFWRQLWRGRIRHKVWRLIFTAYGARRPRFWRTPAPIVQVPRNPNSTELFNCGFIMKVPSIRARCRLLSTHEHIGHQHAIEPDCPTRRITRAFPYAHNAARGSPMPVVFIHVNLQYTPTQLEQATRTCRKLRISFSLVTPTLFTAATPTHQCMAELSPAGLRHSGAGYRVRLANSCPPQKHPAQPDGGRL